MKYYDITTLDIDKGLQKRLGYAKIYVAGKDIAVQTVPRQNSIPVIVKSKDQNVLLKSLKDNSVCGIILEGNLLNKKVIEKASEIRKTIFIPVSYLLWLGVWERQSELQKIKHILSAAHRLKAKVSIITLAENAESLLSKDQMAEIANMIFNTKNSKFSIFGGDLYDN